MTADAGGLLQGHPGVLALNDGVAQQGRLAALGEQALHPIEPVVAPLGGQVRRRHQIRQSLRQLRIGPKALHRPRPEQIRAA